MEMLASAKRDDNFHKYVWEEGFYSGVLYKFENLKSIKNINW